MELIECENRCENVRQCFFIYKYFECDHYQCLKTTILLHYCIQCGNDKLKKYFITSENFNTNSKNINIIN